LSTNANNAVTVSEHDRRMTLGSIDREVEMTAQLRRSRPRPERAALGRLVSILVPLLIALTLAAQAPAAPDPVTIATGMDAGWPDVRGWTRDGSLAQQIAPWGTNQLQFSAYPTYQYGVRVAVGDLNGDGKNEIVTAPGKGAWTELRVFRGTDFKELGRFLPFKDGSWWNGAFVATGDVNGDGRADIVDGLDSGCCTTLHALDGVSGAELGGGFFPFGQQFESGARVAAGDLNGDGKAEVLAAPLAGNRVSAFGPGGGEPFRAYDTFPGMQVGRAEIAVGNVVGTPRPELVAAANTDGGVQVNVLDADSGAVLVSLHPFAARAVTAPQVAVADVDGDGRGDVVALAQLENGTQVKALAADGRELASFFVLEPGIVPGASLAAGDLDGDGKAEIVLGGGPTTTAPWPPVSNGPDQRVVVYRPNGKLVGGFTAYPGLFQGGVRVAVADVERNGRPDLITAPGPGMEPEVDIFSQRWLASRDRGTRVAHFDAYEPGFSGGVAVAAGYWAGNPRIVVAPGPGRAPEVRVFDPNGRLLTSFRAFEAGYTGGLSVAVGDLDADGEPEIVVGTLAAPERIRTFEANGTSFGAVIGPFPPVGRGVEVGVADLNGTGRGVIVAAEASGVDPLLELVDPRSGIVLRTAHPVPAAEGGLRVGAGDLDPDGRDEIVVAPGWAPSGAPGDIVVLGSTLRRKWASNFYPWAGAGMTVAVAPRIGLPLRADGVTLRLRAKQRRQVVVGRFHDVAQMKGLALRATIDWGDGTSWRAVPIRRARADINVRSSKRYTTRGVYRITVTLTDGIGRTSVARSTAVVSRAA